VLWFFFLFYLETREKKKRRFADYSKLGNARAAYIMDPLRCLMTGPGVLSMCAALAAVSDEFDGFLNVKNPFDLPEVQRSKRDHLLLINVVTIFSSGATIGELMKRPQTAEIIVELRANPDGEPSERWSRMLDKVVAILSCKELDNTIARLGVEIQITPNAYAEARAQMHYAYDIARATSCEKLYANFADAGGFVGAKEVVTDTSDITKIYSAAFDGHLSAVLALLNKGADANYVFDGVTPIFAAAQNNHPDLVKALIAAKADLNFRDKEDGTSPLILALMNGNLDVAKQLIAAEADVKLARNDGATPVYVAAQEGNTEILQALIAAGADVNRKGDNGATPVYIAAQFGNTETLQALIAAGADVDLANNNGATPVYIAADNGNTETIQALIAAGADVDLANNKTGTPFALASSKGHVDCVNALLDAKVDINAKTKYGTALDLAVQVNKTEVIAILTAAGAQ
jgi:ankyrin repeat protein